MNRSDSTAAGISAFAASLVAVAVTASLLSAPALAKRPSSFAESRGYQACVAGAERQAQMVKVDSDYFIHRHNEARRFYLNGYAFIDGDSVPVKIACDTTMSGSRLLDVSVDTGQYAGRIVERVEVAGN